MASYETTIIAKPGTAEDVISALKTKVESLIEAHEGTVGLYEDWGTRRMSYNIQSESRGRYLHFSFVANNLSIAELERNFRINENILRFLSVQISKTNDLEKIKLPSPMKRPKKPMSIDDGGDGMD